MTALEKKQHRDRRVTEDREWWQKHLPSDWRLIAFTYRSWARVACEPVPGDGYPSIEVNGRFMCAVLGLDWNTENIPHDY